MKEERGEGGGGYKSWRGHPVGNISESVSHSVSECGKGCPIKMLRILKKGV